MTNKKHYNISDYKKVFFDGMIFMFGLNCVILNLLVNEFLKGDVFLNLNIASMIIKISGFLILFFYIIRAIVSITNASKTDCGYFWLPMFLVLFPIFFIEDKNKLASFISVVIAVAYVVFIIKNTPENDRQLIINEWKLSSAWIAIIGAGFLFVYYLMPEKICNISKSFIRGQLEKALYGSVFVYAIIIFSIALLEHKTRFIKILPKDNENNNS